MEIDLDADGRERFEVRGYQAQLAANPNQMPASNFTNIPKSYPEVNGPYVGGIMGDDVKPLYGSVYSKYKNEYEKK